MQKFNLDNVNASLEKWSMLRYWPSEPRTRAEIGALLIRMVPHREALDWLTDQLLNRIGEWPGPAELRGILCQKFVPLDGIQGYSSLPGFTAEDAEQRYLERQAQESETMLSQIPRKFLEGIPERMIPAEEIPRSAPVVSIVLRTKPPSVSAEELQAALRSHAAAQSAPFCSELPNLEVCHRILAQSNGASLALFQIWLRELIPDIEYGHQGYQWYERKAACWFHRGGKVNSVEKLSDQKLDVTP